MRNESVSSFSITLEFALVMEWIDPLETVASSLSTCIEAYLITRLHFSNLHFFVFSAKLLCSNVLKNTKLKLARQHFCKS